MPPSVNNAWVNVPGKGRVRSAEYRTWREGAGWTIRAARIAKIPGLVAITIRAALPERTRDLDDIAKPLLDALTAFGVIDEDSKAVRIVSEWAADIEKGSVAIEVRQFSAPEVRQRIAVGVREALASSSEAA
jgi:Holliday junction resolvase RusA-like endonuclease